MHVKTNHEVSAKHQQQHIRRVQLKRHLDLPSNLGNNKDILAIICHTYF